MYARVTTVASAPDRIDVATRFVQEQVLPQLLLWPLIRDPPDTIPREVR